jgi:hypothetical protein
MTIWPHCYLLMNLMTIWPCLCWLTKTPQGLLVEELHHMRMPIEAKYHRGVPEKNTTGVCPLKKNITGVCPLKKNTTGGFPLKKNATRGCLRKTKYQRQDG